jgi:hypothetical protein
MTIVKSLGTLTLLCIAFCVCDAQSDRPAPAPNNGSNSSSVSGAKEPLGDQVPSPDFLAKFDELRALAQTVSEEQAGLKILTNKMQDLNAELVAARPQGWQFDPSKRMFVPAPKPAETKVEPPKDEPKEK